MTISTAVPDPNRPPVDDPDKKPPVRPPKKPDQVPPIDDPPRPKKPPVEDPPKPPRPPGHPPKETPPPIGDPEPDETWRVERGFLKSLGSWTIPTTETGSQTASSSRRALSC